VANVLRRLRRICAFHGSHPQFILASATIANPDELAVRLAEGPVTVIDPDLDGSPRGERRVLFFNPPVEDAALGIRRSSNAEAAALAALLLEHDVQTIVFARARLSEELILTSLKEQVARPGRVRGYRGGYLPEERRAIEKGLRDGSVQGVVATNALELGIDIGQLDAAVLAGYPGAIASTRQQMGRAGRRQGRALGILVAGPGGLDQYIMARPEWLLGNSPEHARLNPDNAVILGGHLACAAAELPIRAGDPFGEAPPDLVRELLDDLVEAGHLYAAADRHLWAGEGSPSHGLSLRSAGPDRIVIQTHGAEGPRVIGELDRPGAPLLVYKGAVYLHEGATYLVEQLDWENGVATVRHAAVDYTTRASIGEQVTIVQVRGAAPGMPASASTTDATPPSPPPGAALGSGASPSAAGGEATALDDLASPLRRQGSSAAPWMPASAGMTDATPPSPTPGAALGSGASPSAAGGGATTDDDSASPLRRQGSGEAPGMPASASTTDATPPSPPPGAALGSGASTFVAEGEATTDDGASPPPAQGCGGPDAAATLPEPGALGQPVTRAAWGDVRVARQAASYRIIRRATGEVLGLGAIDLPAQTLDTQGCWLALPAELIESLRAEGLWFSDENDYGPQWPATRNAARLRDGYRCQGCGLPESPGRQHEVHHRIPFRAFVAEPALRPGLPAGRAWEAANRLENLATLCGACHRRAEAGVRIRTGLGGVAALVAGVAPLFLMCDPRDLGVFAEPAAPDTGLPTITLYEQAPGGVGYAEQLFDVLPQVLRAALELVRGCPCERGCPACVGPILDHDYALDAKALSIALLKRLVGVA
jgi:hypothetical protein